MFGTLRASAQTNDDLGWESAGVQYVLEHKEDLLRQRASVLYQMMEEQKMGVRHIATWGTSPYTDPDGVSYLTDIYLYSKDLTEKGDRYYELTIVLYTDKLDGWVVEETELWKSLDKKKPWIESFLLKTEPAIIEDVKIEEKTMLFD